MENSLRMLPERIIIVNDFAYVNGGASQVALSSALTLSERDFDITLFSAVGPVMPDIADSKIDLYLLDQEEIATNRNRISAIVQGIWNKKAGEAMARLLNNYKNMRTIVHLHIWTKSLSSSIVREIVKSGVPLVVTLHDYFTVCPNGGLYNYQTNKICTLRPMSRACMMTNCDKRSFTHKVWRALRQAVQNSIGGMPESIKHFITISDLSERILSQYLPNTAQFHRVRNPITISKREASDPASNEAFLFLGRLDPEKGVLLMGHALASIDAQATFVGEGPMKQKIEQIIPSANMTGWVSAGKVRQYIDQARALVFPSLWYETQGLTVLEAAARGISSIVPDSSAAAEMVVDGVTGLIFKGGDLSDLQDKMQQLKDDNLVKRLGRMAYESYWEQPVTLDMHADALLEVYSTILNEMTGRNESVHPVNRPESLS